MQLHQNITKLLQNLSTLYSSNTENIDSAQFVASAQDFTPNQPVEQLALCTTEKLVITTQLVGMFTQDRGLVTVPTQDAGSVTETTQDRG